MKIKIIKDSKNDLKELTDFLDKYDQTDYHIENGKVVYKGSLRLSYNNLVSLPESFRNLEVKDSLYLNSN